MTKIRIRFCLVLFSGFLCAFLINWANQYNAFKQMITKADVIAEVYMYSSKPPEKKYYGGISEDKYDVTAQPLRVIRGNVKGGICGGTMERTARAVARIPKVMLSFFLSMTAKVNWSTTPIFPLE